jgi:dolichol-phosphate mannosyltransferase
MSDLRSKLFLKSFIKQLIKFAFVGAIGTIINLSILYILTEFFHVYYIFSEMVAFSTAALNNYILDKIWTFKEEIGDQIIKKYFQFITISLLALVVNISILFILVEVYLVWYIYAEIGAICCAFLINFFGNKIWTFNKSNEN